MIRVGKPLFGCQMPPQARGRSLTTFVGAGECPFNEASGKIGKRPGGLRISKLGLDGAKVVLLPVESPENVRIVSSCYCSF